MSYKIKSIKNIEVASVCNMTCSYCLSPQIKHHRKAGLMTFDMFKKVVEKIEYFCKQGTQKEVWIHGTGESLLNTDIVKMVRYIVKRVNKPILLSTNGILMDKEMVLALKNAGISRVDVSTHDKEIARKAHALLNYYGVHSVLNNGQEESRFNWADQMDFENMSDNKPPCPWIANSECFILHDGSIVNCCYDVFGKNILGHIEDDIQGIEIKPFELCEGCNHTIEEPEGE